MPNESTDPAPRRLFFDSHMHTPLCKHARGNPTEYAAVAWERGLKGIVVTCHNPPVGGWSTTTRRKTSGAER